MNRIKLLRETMGVYQRDLAELLNVTTSTIGYYEKEKRSLNTETAITLANYFGVSVDYLLGKEQATNDKRYYMCPVYGRISAGEPKWADECIEGRIPLDLDMMNIVNPEEYFFLKVNGESMNKLIKNGAFALIHKQDYVENGETAVVLVDNEEATLKIFNKQDNVVVLTPNSNENTFTPQIYTKANTIKVLGKYVGKMEFN